MQTDTLPLADLVGAEFVEIFEVEILGFVAQLQKRLKARRGRREKLDSAGKGFRGRGRGRG